MGRSGTWRRLLLAALAAGTAVIAASCGAQPGQRDEQDGPAAARTAITDAQRQTMRQMDEAAERAYASVQEKDLEQTRIHLAQLSVIATKLSYDGIATVDGIEAVAWSIAEAAHSLNAVQPDHAAATTAIVRARLAVDALSHRGQPMWLEFSRPVMDDLERMSAAAAARNDPAASEALALLRGHVSVVRPAVVVSKQSSEAVKLDSVVAFLDSGVRSADWSGIVAALPGMKEAVADVFRMDSSDRPTVSPLMPTAEPPHPVVWSVGLGSFIVAVLAYVAWRRYDAEHGIIKVKRARDFDSNR